MCWKTQNTFRFAKRFLQAENFFKREKATLWPDDFILKIA